MCSMPSAVEKRAAIQLDVGSSPTRRSVPGPVKCRASKRRSVSRSAAPTSVSARSRHVATGSSLVEPQDVQDLLPQALERLGLRPRSGKTSCAQAGVGHGTAVQFVVRSLTTFAASLRNGSWSRPARAGIEVVEQPRRDRAGQPDARRARSPSARSRSPYQGGT